MKHEDQKIETWGFGSWMCPRAWVEVWFIIDEKWYYHCLQIKKQAPLNIERKYENSDREPILGCWNFKVENFGEPINT